MLSEGPVSVTVAAPCRADLAGGTLDIWPLGLLHEQAVTVNLAIPVEVRLRVTTSACEPGVIEHRVGSGPPRTLGDSDASSDLTAAVVLALAPEGGVRVEVESQAPLGSGLGGSSSYGVALATAMHVLLGETTSDQATVALVRDLEARVLRAPTGTQDHWAAVRGGALAVHLEPGGELVEALAVDRRWLAERLTVFFTGITHHSGMVNWKVVRRRLDGDDRVRSAFDGIAAAARRVREALIAGDEGAVGAAIADDWSARRRLAPEVCPPELARIETVARSAGAHAVKATGAGGGGSVLLWHGPGGRPLLVAALEAAVAGRGRALASGVAPEGCRVLAGPAPVSL